MNNRNLILSAALVLAYIYTFAGPGLSAGGLSPDDLQNLHFAWSRSIPDWLLSNVTFWSNSYRPMGSLVYALLLRTAGLNPLPYHATALLLIGLNALLVWDLVRRLLAVGGGSHETGALAAALASIHVNYQVLYYNTGFLYDLLCFTFYFATLDLYVRMRARQSEDRAQLAGLLILFACALDSKEMAVSIPLMAYAYDVLFHARWRPTPFTIASSLMTVAYVAGKASGDTALFRDPVYRPTFTAGAYLSAWVNYFNDLFITVDFFNVGRAALLLAVLLAFSVPSRIRLWGWLLMVLGILPIALIPPRGLGAAYIPMTGLAIICADLVARVRAHTVPSAPAPALLAAILAALSWIHVSRGIYDAGWILGQERMIAAQIPVLRARLPDIPRHSKILVIHDPFEKEPWGRWSSTFLLRMMKDDPDLDVVRFDQLDPAEAATAKASPDSYAAVIDFAPNGHGLPLSP